MNSVLYQVSAVGIPSSVGPYTLRGQIGQGGMASVFAATGPSGDVALKVLNPAYAENNEVVGLFVAEGALAMRLHHPHLVRALDAGRAGADYFIAFELLRGPTLDELMQAQTFSPSEAAQLVCDVLFALEPIHALGLVHCDVNPKNILLAGDTGTTKLIDFGVVTRAGEKQSAVRGTYGYLSPEQARGRPLDARSDVFSVGVILWELWSGRRLFAREALHLTLAATVEDPAPALLNGDWDDLVQRALAKDPNDRFPSADAFRTALAAYV